MELDISLHVSAGEASMISGSQPGAEMGDSLVVAMTKNIRFKNKPSPEVVKSNSHGSW